LELGKLRKRAFFYPEFGDDSEAMGVTDTEEQCRIFKIKCYEDLEWQGCNAM
jgi:hypothetical protein